MRKIYRVPEVEKYDLNNCFAKMQSSGILIIPPSDCGCSISSIDGALVAQTTILPANYATSQVNTIDYEVVFEDATFVSAQGSTATASVRIFVEGGDVSMDIFDVTATPISITADSMYANYANNDYTIANMNYLYGTIGTGQPQNITIHTNVSHITGVNVVDNNTGIRAEATSCSVE